MNPNDQNNVLELLDQIIGCKNAFEAVTKHDDPEDTLADIPYVLQRLSEFANDVALAIDPNFKPTTMRNRQLGHGKPKPGHPGALLTCNASPYFNERTWSSRGWTFTTDREGAAYGPS